MRLGAGLAAFPAVPTVETRGDGATEGDPAVEVMVFVLLIVLSVRVLLPLNARIQGIFLLELSSPLSNPTIKQAGRILQLFFLQGDGGELDRMF